MLPHVIEFNLTNSRQYTDQEYEGRMAEAWPYRLFVLLGGARGNPSLMGEGGAMWMQMLTKARTVTGVDDPTVLNTWAENQYRRIMGLDLLPMANDPSQLGDTLMGAPTTLMG